MDYKFYYNTKEGSFVTWTENRKRVVGYTFEDARVLLPLELNKKGQVVKLLDYHTIVKEDKPRLATDKEVLVYLLYFKGLENILHFDNVEMAMFKPYVRNGRVCFKYEKGDWKRALSQVMEIALKSVV